MDEIATLKEAKLMLRKNFEKGSKCPCCNQLVKMYRHTINASYAKSLIALVKLQQIYNRPIHVSELLVYSKLPMISAKHFAVLKHWSLISETENNDERKRKSGYWVATETAIDFVKGKCTVPKYKWIYNSRPYKTSNEQTSISECLRKHFDYEEFMGKK